MKFPDIYEQTLRDGLMTRPQISSAVKKDLITRLLSCGIHNFEVVRFPIDGKYPQFDDGIQFLQSLEPIRSKAIIAAFAMGDEGIKEAMKYTQFFHQLHVPCFVSDNYSLYAFGTRNWSHSLKRIESAFEKCAKCGTELTVGIGTVFGCPLSNDHSVERTVRRLNEIIALGIDCLMLGDTAGTATPELVRETLTALTNSKRPKTIRVHFHNTSGRALLNTWTAILCGVDGVDTSLLGLGGEPHPYFIVPDLVSNGNCPTEDVVDLLAKFKSTPEVAKTATKQRTTTDSQFLYDASKLFDTCRWFSRYLSEIPSGRSSFAEFIPVKEINDHEIPQGTHRH